LPEAVRYALLSLVVFLTHFQEAITGFGGTALAVPFVIFLVGLDVTVKVLVIQAWIVNAFIVLSARRHIVWRHYGRILLFAGIGLPLGVYMLHALPKPVLRLILGVAMVIVAVRGLNVTIRNNHLPKWNAKAWQNWLMNAILFVGGVVHGAFASGGPFVVVYATRVLTDKGIFRVTLSMLWLTLNTTLIAWWLAAGTLTHQVWFYTAICTPFTVVGMIAGDRCHRCMDERLFRMIVYGVLFASGLAVLNSARGGG